MTVETGPYQLHPQPKANAPLLVKITYISVPRLQGNPPILCLWYPINLLSHCVSRFQYLILEFIPVSVNVERSISCTIHWDFNLNSASFFF